MQVIALRQTESLLEFNFEPSLKTVIRTFSGLNISDFNIGATLHLLPHSETHSPKKDAMYPALLFHTSSNVLCQKG